jgi:hypothetical protein
MPIFCFNLILCLKSFLHGIILLMCLSKVHFLHLLLYLLLNAFARINQLVGKIYLSLYSNYFYTFLVKKMMLDIAENFPGRQIYDKYWCGQLENILHIYNCAILNEDKPKVKYEEL